MDVLVVAVVLVLLPLAFVRPFAGAVLYTALAYFRPQNLVGGLAMEMRLSLLVMAATLAGLGLAWFRGKEKPLLWTPWTALVLALVAVTGLATRTAVFPDLAMSAWLGFLKTLAGVALTVVLCTSGARVRIIAFTAAAALGAMTIVSLVNPVWDVGRLTGGGGDFRDSNDFALALCMILPILLCAWRASERALVRVALLALVPLFLTAIVLTQSRGGFLALGAVLGAWALTTRGRVFKIALAPAAVLGFLAVAPPEFLERMTTIQDYSHDSSARDRLSSWRVARRIAEDRPLTGVGPGNFLVVYDRYSNDFRSPHVAHNTPLQLLADAGVFAPAAFGGLLLYGIGASVRLARRARSRRQRATTRKARRSYDWVDALGTAFALSLLAYAVGCQFLSRDDMDLFYLLTGLAAATGVHTRQFLARPARERGVVRGRVVEGAACAPAV